MSVEGQTKKARVSMGYLTRQMKDLFKETLFGVETLRSYSKGLETITGISNVLGKSQRGQIRNLDELFDVYSLLDETAPSLAAATAALSDAYQEMAPMVGWLGKAQKAGAITGREYQSTMESLSKEFLGGAVNMQELAEATFFAQDSMRAIIPRLHKFRKRMLQARTAGFALLPAMFGLWSISKHVGKVWSALVGTTSDVAWGFDDIAMILLDLGEVLMEPVMPIMDYFIGILEGGLQWVEGWHPALKGLAFGLIAVSLGGALALSTIADLVVAGQGLITGFWWMMEKSETFSKYLGGPFLKVLGWVSGKFSALREKIFSFVSTAGEALFGFFKGIVQSISAKVVPALVFMKGHVASLAIGVGALIATFLIVDQLLSGLPTELRKPVSAIVALIGAIVAATVAWLAFHGTMTVGVAIPIILAAVGAGIAGIKGMITSYEGLRGGIEFGEPSTIRVHEGERLYGRGGRTPYQPKEIPPTIIIETSGSSLDEIVRKAVRKTWDEASEYYAKRYRRSEYS